MRLLVGTCINLAYLDRAHRYLSMLDHPELPAFCVCYGFEPSQEVRQRYPHVSFHHLPADVPKADCHGCIQYGAWLRAVPCDEDDVLILTDADGFNQRPLTVDEHALLTGIGPMGVALGYNAGPEDTLRDEACRICYIGRTDDMEAHLEHLYPGFAKARCWQGGLIAARPAWWRAMTTWFEAEWPRFSPIFWHRAKCQWLLSWLIHRERCPVTVLGPEIHSNGHFGTPAGVWWDSGRSMIVYNNNPVWFAHHL